MAKYRKKPVVIEADQYDGEHLPSVLEEADARVRFQAPLSEDDAARTPPYGLYVDTEEGTMRVSKGDWVIVGVNGEVYPCKPDIFEKTYEPAEG